MSERTSITAVPGEPTLVIARLFDAPRELVFKAHTDPDAIPQWWGPARYATTVDEMDVRPGGRWRYIQRDAQGNEHTFSGEYREVVPSERLVHTFRFEGAPGDAAFEMVNTITFEERDGGTLVTEHAVFDSVETRDRELQPMTEGGGLETWDRLAGYLAQVRA